MTETLDRRNPKISRVELATLVDICARDANLPPFQAQSGNISGRGMQVRTSCLPEIGAPLVCRFEHEQREVLVEGRVAWRSEGEDGGEFGIQFTAVDADSAEILRSLRPMSSVSSAFGSRPSSRTREPEMDEDDELLLLKSGDRVRLHIDGLAAPMKACVHESSERRVRLGSNLEFLKMGRPVEIENVDGGERRSAKVDSVNVVLNPSTSVPELVVMLRYEGDKGSSATGFAEDLDESSDAAQDDDFDEPRALGEATQALRARVADAFSKAQGALSWARGAAAKMSHEARHRVSAARERMSETSPQSQPAARRPLRVQTGRRSTPAARPSNIARAGISSKRPAPNSSGSLRPSSRTGTAAPRATSRKGWGFALGALSILGLLLLSAFALKAKDESSAAKSTPPAPTATLPSPGAAAPLPNSTSPAPLPPSAVATAPAPARPNAEGIVAEVPLFGARPITTSEAVSKPNEGEAALEKRAAAASVPDEQFKTPEMTPEKEALTTWGRGQLNLPTVHRIRLDAAGAEIVGVAEPAGFAVVVPGRKAMETGRTIEKRDRRILRVKTSNTAEGARINFEFRGPVPPYRVRLKNDFIEFFVSAPEGVRAEL
jgi:hypothetical protein